MISKRGGTTDDLSQSVMSSLRRRDERLRSQIVTSKKGRGGRRYRPYAFTEQGVAMLSSVLRSSRAVEVNIAIMRTFVQLRRLMDSNRDLARKIEALEKKYDEQHGVRGRRRVDCIGRMVMRPSESGDRESICGGLRSNQRVNHATIAAKETDRISSLEIAPVSATAAVVPVS